MGPGALKTKRTHHSRRSLLATLAAGAFGGLSAGCGSKRAEVQATPSFLKDYEVRYRESPRTAALEWFESAKFGLSFRYGVYRQLAANEWVQFDRRVPADKYESLQQSFDPSSFDAEQLADFAIEAGTRYIRFPARLADGFCLFRTNESAFTSLDSPPRRDLVKEMCDACEAKGLGLFLEYAYALDWRHPYFYPRDSVQLDWPYAGLDEGLACPRQFQNDEDFLHYIRYVHAQLKEILYRYVPLAGMALTPVMGYYARRDLFPLATTYEIIREAQPQILICFEQGANGDEDFTSLTGEPGPHPKGGEPAKAAWEANRSKPVEWLVDTTRAKSAAVVNSSGWSDSILLQAHLRETGALGLKERDRLLQLMRVG